jgi:fucose permease
MKLVAFIDKQYRLLYVALLIDFVLFGMSFTVIGAILPSLIDDLGWKYTVVGVVISAIAIGYFCSTFFSGMLNKRYGPKAVIVIGLIIHTIGLLFFAWKPFIILNIMFNFFIGIGIGSTEVVVNYCVVRMEQNGQSRLLNLMHAAFSIGAIAGPFIAGRLSMLLLDWRIIYRAFGILSFFVASTMAFSPFDRIGVESNSYIRTKDMGKLIHEPLIMLFFFIILIYVGLELGASSWIAEYCVSRYNVSISSSAFIVSLFWTGQFIGRLLVSFSYRGSKGEWLVLLFSILSTVSLLSAVITSNLMLSIAGFFITGFGYSAIYPVVMSLVGVYFNKEQSVAIGIVSTGGGIGTFLLPFVMAALSDSYGIQQGFYFYIIGSLIMAILSLIVILYIRNIRTGTERSEKKTKEILSE